MATIIDLGVILILLISAGVSFFRGFIREVLTIVGVIGGAFAALMFGKSLIPYTRDWFGVVEGQDPGKLFNLIPYEIVADVTAYAIIFLVVFIILQLASHFFSAAIRAMGLGPVDRTLGVAFGIARGVLLLGILYLPFYVTNLLPEKNKQEWFNNSKTFFYVEATSKWLAGYLPSSKEDAIDSTREKLKQLDVLDSGKSPAVSNPDVSGPLTPMPDDVVGPQDGYKDTDRMKLDGLIENQTPASPAAPATDTELKDYNE